MLFEPMMIHSDALYTLKGMIAYLRAQGTNVSHRTTKWHIPVNKKTELCCPLTALSEKAACGMA